MPAVSMRRRLFNPSLVAGLRFVEKPGLGAVFRLELLAEFLRHVSRNVSRNDTHVSTDIH